MGGKKSKALIVALVMVSLCALSAEGLSGDENSIGAESGITSALLNNFKKLPGVWSLKRKAKKEAARLPDYQGQVQAPDTNVIWGWLQDFCSTPNRRPGTEYDHRAEKWVRDKMTEIGLEKVTMDPVDMTVWQADKWSLSAGGENIPSFFVLNTAFTGPEGVTAPMVYVGEGRAKDFAKLDVKGKIVVADVPFPYMPTAVLLKGLGVSYTISDPDKWMTMGYGQYLNFVRANFMGQTNEKTAPDNDVYWNAYKNGAAAICLILKDQPSGSNSHYGPYDGIMKPIPGLWIGKREGERLREMAVEGKGATLVLEGTKKPGVMHNVWGVLPGMSDEIILVTSHHDSPFEGASEDGAGTVQVLSQAWAWSHVPKEQRPKTMVFVVDGGHFYGSEGAHRFAREHPELMKKVRILITLEHLGAKEVEEDGSDYKETGRLALTVMFTSHEVSTVAAVMKAFQKKPPHLTASIPSDLFGKAPTSDAAGYVLESGVPVISWIGCPYYLLDEHDTLDKIDKDSLKPISETVIEIVKVYMAME